MLICAFIRLIPAVKIHRTTADLLHRKAEFPLPFLIRNGIFPLSAAGLVLQRLDPGAALKDFFVVFLCLLFFLPPAFDPLLRRPVFIPVFELPVPDLAVKGVFLFFQPFRRLLMTAAQAFKLSGFPPVLFRTFPVPFPRPRNGRLPALQIFLHTGQLRLRLFVRRRVFAQRLFLRRQRRGRFLIFFLNLRPPGLRLVPALLRLFHRSLIRNAFRQFRLMGMADGSAYRAGLPLFQLPRHEAGLSREEPLIPLLVFGRRFPARLHTFRHFLCPFHACRIHPAHRLIPGQHLTQSGDPFLKLRFIQTELFLQHPEFLPELFFIFTVLFLPGFQR